MKFHVALFIVTTTIAAGSAAAQSQKPTDPSHDSQHHEMMQGLMDAPFVQMMSKHHQQGIEMARTEEERGASASVKQLATKIRQSQEKELAELKGHSEHHAGATGTSGSSEHDKMMDQQGQAMIINRMASEPKVTFSGSVVYPIINKAEVMDLSVKTIDVARKG